MLLSSPPRNHPLRQLSFHDFQPQTWRIGEHEFACQRLHGSGEDTVLNAAGTIVFTRIVGVHQGGDEMQIGGMANRWLGLMRHEIDAVRTRQRRHIG